MPPSKAKLLHQMEAAKRSASKRPVTPVKTAHKLKPCPFCRSVDVKLVVGVCYPYVQCVECLANGSRAFYPVGDRVEETQHRVVRVWNGAPR